VGKGPTQDNAASACSYRQNSQIDPLGAIQAVQQYDPYGQPFGEAGIWMGTFGYAGEQIDSTGLPYNRARTYNPALGAFASLDPFEGIEDKPMSMNGYAVKQWVSSIISGMGFGIPLWSWSTTTLSQNPPLLAPPFWRRYCKKAPHFDYTYH